MGKLKRKRKEAKEIEDAIMNPEKRRKKEIKPEILIPSGSTMVDLACSDTIHGAFGIGKLTNIIGDSSAGKTFLILTSLAVCANDTRFDDYDLIYDEPESADEFDTEYLFGKKAVKRITVLDEDEKSDTVEDFFKNILIRLNGDKPFIYVIDSWDALSSKAEQDRAKELRDKGKIDGSYKTEKARMASEIFRVICDKLCKSKSALIIISQTRDNIGFGAQFSPKVRSGGKALKFYSTHEMWLAVIKKEKKTIRRLKKEIGVRSEIKVTKNKLTGKNRTAQTPINYDYGIDDITSCVDFMIEVGEWKKKGTKIITDDFMEVVSKRKLIEEIESNKREQELREYVGRVWSEIEDQLKSKRKPRFE